MTTTWKPSTPSPTDSEAQAYVNGWYHCIAGNDIRFGCPYESKTLAAMAWYTGGQDCMEYENDDTPDPHFAGFNGAPAIETTPAAAYREGWNAYWLRWGDAVNPYEPMTALSHAWEAGASDRKRCILTMKCPDPTELGFPDTV